MKPWGFSPEPLRHLPRDPQKARIGSSLVNPEASSCTFFWEADVLHPENNQNAPLEQIGYSVHAHCWVLVGRIIGLDLIKANLKLFLTAVEQFWAQNADLWDRSLSRAEANYDRQLDACPDDSSDLPSETESEIYDSYDVILCQNPAVVPRIQEIIEQATQSHSESPPQPTPSSLVSHVPLDIAIQIVECSKLVGIKDTRNMLAAFGWRLPDSYWKKSCNMDLIFEYADLHKANCPVDWQFIGLATEELMGDPKWKNDSACGLGTRLWIFRQLEQIKSVFLDLLEQEKLNPKCLSEAARRKHSLRNRLL